MRTQLAFKLNGKIRGNFWSSITLICVALLTSGNSLAAESVPKIQMSVSAEPSHIAVKWPISANWTWVTENNWPAISLNIKIQIPAELNANQIHVTKLNGDEIKMEYSRQSGILHFISSEAETRFQIATSTGPMSLKVKTIRQSDFFFRDSSCAKFNLDFKPLKQMPTSYFAGVKCRPKADNTGTFIILSTAGDSLWFGSSFHEVEGKGERWKVFELKTDVSHLKGQEELGRMSWGGDQQHLDYQIIYTPPDNGKPAEAETSSAVSGQAGVTLFSLSTNKKTTTGTTAASGPGLGIFAQVFMNLGKSNVIVDLGGLVQLTNLASGTGNSSLSQVDGGLGYRMGKNKFTLTPVLGYGNFSVSSSLGSVSSSIQSPNGKMIVTYTRAPKLRTELIVSYLPSLDPTVTGSLIQASLSHSFSWGKFYPSVGLGFETESVSTTSAADGSTQTLSAQIIGANFGLAF